MKSEGQRRSQAQEKRLAKDLGGRVQKASGASDFAKGDTRTVGDIRAEAKSTTKDEFILKLEDLKKIELESKTGSFEDAVFQVEFVGSLRLKIAVVGWQQLAAIFQAAAGRSCVDQSFWTSNKSWKMRKWDLARLLHNPRVDFGYARLTFMEPNDIRHEYAVLDWSTFMELRNEAKGAAK